MHLSTFAKFTFIALYLLAIAYTHLRGKVRLKIFRQLFDHSSLLAPVNAIMYLFSAVPNKPFLELSQFPELEILKNNWLIIREEAQYLYQEGYISASDKNDDIGFNSFFRRGWKRFYLKWYQDPMASAIHLCPNTLALIQQIPSINAAMFALLPKKSFLFEHRDPYAGSLRYHLGLITPNSQNCYIQVDDKTYFWKDGEDILFDETYIHHAKNNTNEDRIILFCDVKRPLKYQLANKFNSFFSSTIMKAAASKNLPHESVGVINKLFKYIYQIRLLSKKLKSYNRMFYYLIKFSLFFLLGYWVFIH
ncbi:aspartyl/asparaginyl beta-hydroxylase domain-containing protein (plasmid) [Legionella sp. D16C41]|uniref:aspartyl/asparaginyl beta-hydroxylase domain-containing protein n=1 Tax=Legionella sp. D16C41 TaxID=3402688 RepID=UPI003AF59A61